MKLSNKTTIAITRELLIELHTLRIAMGMKDISDTIQWLINKKMEEIEK